jgi:hypothetical protein
VQNTLSVARTALIPGQAPGSLCLEIDASLRRFRVRVDKMRDLLYLSDRKIEALAPQLPGRLKRRLGLEAGLNIGVASVKAQLPGDDRQTSVALLDAVVKMIDRERAVRRRTESTLTAGDWIQFEENFWYGDAWPGHEGGPKTLSGLVYFVAENEPPFVLVGSAAHVLDRRQSINRAENQVGTFYVDAVRAYAREVNYLADEGATTALDIPAGWSQRSVLYGVYVLATEALNQGGTGEEGWSGLVRLSGRARVLAAGSTGSGPLVLATPLYIEYASH